MSDWANGYRACLQDLRTLAAGRSLMSDALALLCADLEGDAHVIGHEQDNRVQKRKLRAAKEALPLFAEEQ